MTKGFLWVIFANKTTGMKANQLRIGNLVRKEYFEQGKKTYEDIHSVSGYDLSELEVNGYIEHDDERLEPIPLTEGWLSDMQFKSCPKNKNFPHIEMPYYAHNAVLLFYNEERTRFESTHYLAGYGSMRDGGYYVTTFRWIWSVHELQNLYFALTGEELTRK